MIKIIVCLCFIPIILTTSYHEIRIDSDDDCSTDKEEKHYATLLRFSSKVAYGRTNCSIDLTNPWLIEMQNGFGVFLPRATDCGSMVTIQCLPETVLFNRTLPAPLQYNCHSSNNQREMPCSTLRVTYQRNIKMDVEKKSTQVQVVALTKGPCLDSDVHFSCFRDYPQSCIHANLRCNGRSECPMGQDEAHCHNSPPSGSSILYIILAIVGFLFLICILSTVLICCFCRAAVNGLLRHFRSKKRNETVAKGDVTISGEDAGLIQGLTGQTTAIELSPQQPPPRYQVEPAALMIDSTKPIYPRLE